MNKIIPFNKDITFNEKIGEIESIALDDTLKFIEPYTIKGELIVRGCNKYLDVENEFSYPLPVEIAVDSKYDTKKASINIDDFYYEIINDNILRVKIDLILDDLEYQKEEIKEDSLRLDYNVDIKKDDDLFDASIDLLKKGEDGFNTSMDLLKKGDELFDAKLDLEKKGNIPFLADASIKKESDQKLDANLSLAKGNKEETKDTDKIMDLFKENDEPKEYSIYRVYTMGENDTIDSILKKYGITKEDLENYNDLGSLKTGDKLIIPSTDE